ncbi:hypothetical protein [Helicobacter equorum]|uniref:hypothetical protein n=1 Tax=Helicobacter equorum TaxID=361872 RepID=UPI001FD231FB|nr:hypothetical protein [Helicobacter equorum]
MHSKQAKNEAYKHARTTFSAGLSLVCLVLWDNLDFYHHYSYESLFVIMPCIVTQCLYKPRFSDGR